LWHPHLPQHLLQRWLQLLPPQLPLLPSSSLPALQLHLLLLLLLLPYLSTAVVT
jgi:hypothetical protein